MWLIYLFLIFVVIALFLKILPFILIALCLFLIYGISLHIRKIRYFKSPGFLEQKQKIADTIIEFNEISEINFLVSRKSLRQSWHLKSLG